MYWELDFLRMFLCTIVSPYFIVKSLQLRGYRQIAEPYKYCLVRVIVFFGVVFSICFVSHRLEFWLNSLHKVHGSCGVGVQVGRIVSIYSLAHKMYRISYKVIYKIFHNIEYIHL